MTTVHGSLEGRVLSPDGELTQQPAVIPSQDDDGRVGQALLLLRI